MQLPHKHSWNPPLVIINPNKSPINGDTNFSATGNLQIASRENTFTRQPKNNIENDAQQLQRDLQNRAKNVEVDSSVYTQVPIAEFGAALLRGMGWKGNDGNSKKREDSFQMPRPHRLGLGATPTLPELSSSNKNETSRSSPTRSTTRTTT